MTPTLTPEPAALDFLWVELTNKCNLECAHCYADSAPSAPHGTLSPTRHVELLTEAHALGCRRVQFIGGEPTLNRSLPALIAHAANLGFDRIEVYTNLVALSDDLLDCFTRYGVCVATSIYSNQAAVHDLIATSPGSWSRTVRNLIRLVAHKVPVRASIIEMDLNRGAVEPTTEWLRSLGVDDIGCDRIRRFGRGNAHREDASELCGNCASGTLCVSPDGVVTPCIMSKSWPVGSLTEEGATLAGIVSSRGLAETRSAIRDATWEAPEFHMGGCQPDSRNPCGPDCGPSRNCMPCSPNTNCGPNSCRLK